MQREQASYDQHLSSVAAQFGHGFAMSLHVERAAVRAYALPTSLGYGPCFANTFGGADETIGFEDVLNVARDSPDAPNLNMLDRDAMVLKME